MCCHNRKQPLPLVVLVSTYIQQLGADVLQERNQQHK